MTRKQKFIKAICEILGAFIGWWLCYVLSVVVCVLFGYNPMEETLVAVALGVYCLFRIEALAEKIGE